MSADSGQQAPETVDALLRAGIAAAKAGRRERARELLMRVVEQDEECVQGWLWLSGVVDSLADQEVCLENVLTLDPGQEAARTGLEWVRQRMALLQAAADDVVPPAFEPAVSRVAEGTREAAPAEKAADSSPQAEAGWGGLDRETSCPYCGSATSFEDRKCAACGGRLWTHVRRREDRSVWLWVAMALQVLGTIEYGSVPVGMLVFAASKAKVADPVQLMMGYLGFPGFVSPQTLRDALVVVPRIHVLAALVPVLFSLALVFALYARWRPAFYMFLLNAAFVLGLGFVMVGATDRIGPICGGALAGLARLLENPVVPVDSLVGEVAGVVQGIVPVCGAGGAAVGVLSFLLGFRLDDDLSTERRRILLRLDPGVSKGLGCLIHARRYAKGRMWALAALHLQRGIANMPTDWLDGRLELASAYMHLRRFDTAERVLADARKVSPDHPRVAELSSVLEAQRREGNEGRPGRAR